MFRRVKYTALNKHFISLRLISLFQWLNFITHIAGLPAWKWCDAVRRNMMVIPGEVAGCVNLPHVHLHNSLQNNMQFEPAPAGD